jgi:hypothetical protein
MASLSHGIREFFPELAAPHHAHEIIIVLVVAVLLWPLMVRLDDSPAQMEDSTEDWTCSYHVPKVMYENHTKIDRTY